MKEQTLEDELMKLEQKLYDIETFCKSFDPGKLTDHEKVILDSIMLIINGTIKVFKKGEDNENN